MANERKTESKRGRYLFVAVAVVVAVALLALQAYQTARTYRAGYANGQEDCDEQSNGDTREFGTWFANAAGFEIPNRESAYYPTHDLVDCDLGVMLIRLPGSFDHMVHPALLSSEMLRGCDPAANRVRWDEETSQWVWEEVVFVIERARYGSPFITM